MRRILLAVATALGMVVSLVGLPASPASADAGDLVADVGVTVSDSPDPVQPPGGGVVYTVTVTNNGPAGAPAIVVDNSTSAGTFDLSLSTLPSECSAPADSAAAPSFSCTFGETAAGESHVLKVGIRTPSTAGVVSHTASAHIPLPLLEELGIADPAGSLLDPGAPNSDTEVTTVAPGNATATSCAAEAGDTCTFTSTTVNAVLTVRSGRVIVTLSDAQGSGDQCGDDLCGDGLGVVFDEDPEYQGTVGIDLTFGVSAPCRGVGDPSGCADIYIRKDGQVFKAPACSATSGSPCVERVYNSPTAETHWVVFMESDDPDLLPPLKI